MPKSKLANKSIEENEGEQRQHALRVFTNALSTLDDVSPICCSAAAVYLACAIAIDHLGMEKERFLTSVGSIWDDVKRQRTDNKFKLN